MNNGACYEESKNKTEQTKRLTSVSCRFIILTLIICWFCYVLSVKTEKENNITLVIDIFSYKIYEKPLIVFNIWRQGFWVLSLPVYSRVVVDNEYITRVKLISQ
jgi:hypothetical protein